MAQDVLNLGGITFTAYSTPDTMGAGGQQGMNVHRLPGGSRIVDQTGPDEYEISWRGSMFDDNAYERCLRLDAMRQAGAVLPLTWGGQFRSVIIASFTYRVRRLPVWVEYSIGCTVVVNPQMGNVGVQQSSTDTLVGQDLASAAAAVANNSANAINTISRRR